MDGKQQVTCVHLRPVTDGYIILKPWTFTVLMKSPAYCMWLKRMTHWLLLMAKRKKKLLRDFWLLYYLTCVKKILNPGQTPQKPNKEWKIEIISLKHFNVFVCTVSSSIKLIFVSRTLVLVVNKPSNYGHLQQLSAPTKVSLFVQFVCSL